MIRPESPYNQVVVWPATIVGEENVEAFVSFIAENLNETRAKYLGEVLTKPDLDDFGRDVPGTGGRNDVLFAIHDDDIGKFAVPRFQFGMRWLEDLYLNGHGHLYPAEIAELRQWGQEPTTAETDEYLEDGSETGCVGD